MTWLAERLGIRAGRDVLDLAAGTGKLTRMLVPLGARLVAVEPVAEMRARLHEIVPEARALDGTAESIPLPDASADAVTCAQAFHWFRADEALSEIHRVLRPGGALALVWNARDFHDQLQLRIAEILEPHRGDVGSHRDIFDPSVIPESGLFGPVEKRTWPYEQHVSMEGLLDRFSSVSFVAAMSLAERAALLEEIREAAEGRGEPIRLPHVTEIYVADRLTIGRPTDTMGP